VPPEEFFEIKFEEEDDGWLINTSVCPDLTSLRAHEMKKELDLEGGALTAAFESYEPLLDHEKDLDVTLIKTYFGLNQPCVALCWNITGTICAASFGDMFVSGWSEIPNSGEICIWRCFRDSQEVRARPPSNSLVLCIAFHREKPSVFVTGSYNGEVSLWDVTQAADPLVASSDIGEYLHQDSVHAVEWLDDRIISLGADGKILFWDVQLGLQYPSRGFMVCAKKVDAFGGRSLAVSTIDYALFCVGSETGLVFKGVRPPTIPSNVPIPNWTKSSLKVLDEIGMHKRKIQAHVEAHASRTGAKEITAEVLFASKVDPGLLFPPAKVTELEPHQGPVQMLAFSPFNRKLMLSCSFDGSVRLYDVTMSRPLHVWCPYPQNISCPISAVSWSHSRPLVFACCSESNAQVCIFDLVENKHGPSLTIDLSADSRGAVRIAFNPVQRSVLAIGDFTGRLHLYRLPSALTESTPEERKLLQRMTGAGGK